MPRNIEHDYKCDNCNKPATVNLQSVWTRYTITKEGGFEDAKTLSVYENEFYCNECAEKEKII